MPHGGPRAPDRRPRPPAGPGKYSNRQDLSRQGPPQRQGAYAPPGLPYGDRQAALRAQTVAPVPGRAAPPAPPPAAPSTQPAPPGSVPTLANILARPTSRPDEPLTTGLPIGLGPGPEALGSPYVDDLREQLVALYQAHPNPHLRELIEDYDNDTTV